MLEYFFGGVYPTSSHLLIIFYNQNLTLKYLEHSIKYKHYKISLSGIFMSSRFSRLNFSTKLVHQRLLILFFLCSWIGNILSASLVDDTTKGCILWIGLSISEWDICNFVRHTFPFLPWTSFLMCPNGQWILFFFVDVVFSHQYNISLRNYPLASSHIQS